MFKKQNTRNIICNNALPGKDIISATINKQEENKEYFKYALAFTGSFKGKVVDAVLTFKSVDIFDCDKIKEWEEGIEAKKLLLKNSK